MKKLLLQFPPWHLFIPDRQHLQLHHHYLLQSIHLRQLPVLLPVVCLKQKKRPKLHLWSKQANDRNACEISKSASVWTVMTKGQVLLFCTMCALLAYGKLAIKQQRDKIRLSFDHYCRQRSSLLWSSVLRHHSGPVRWPRDRRGIGRHVLVFA